MKRFIIILMLVLFLASPAVGTEYTSTVGDNWLIKNADLQNCTGLSGNTWIETLIRLPGDMSMWTVGLQVRRTEQAGRMRL